MVPFLIRWPGKISPGKDDLLLSIPDIMPTLLELIGLEENIPSEIEGNSYSEIFLGGEMKRPDSALYLCNSPEKVDGGDRGLRTHNYTFVIKNIKNEDKRSIILHDNKNDPYQLKNIANEKPQLIVDLREKLMKRLKEINDPWLNEIDK